EVSQARLAAATIAVGTARKKGRRDIEDAPKSAELSHTPCTVRSAKTFPGGCQLSLSIGAQFAHPLSEGGALVGGQDQALLGAPPQHIVGLDRPFLAHEIADLGLIEMAAEMTAEIGRHFHVFEKIVDAGAVPPRQHAD